MPYLTFTYCNYSQRSQIIRISDPSKWVEKTLLPEQCAFLEALPQSQLEIHTTELVTATLAERLQCRDLIL